ncbi:uncharacterized protein [Medicago truncatula]|uniref:uncharacterized protein n=1 Tax=Medicago truncatula TaxID=3880 RepID=UPI00196860B5|nr:uncharacterized protein LOC120579555 [Medicago truncatula]
MDRSWMYNRVNANRHRLKKKYVCGVQKFVKRALKQPICIFEGGIRCPCTKCKCTKISTPVNVRLHLYQNGFQPEYWIWTEHGEVKPIVDESGGLGSNDHVHHDGQFDVMDKMLYDAFRLYEDVPHANANIGNELLAEGELPNTNAKKFYDKLISFNKPIYEGATESKLSISVKLLSIMANWHVPQKGIDFFAQMLKNVCPVKKCFPENCYQATQLVSKLGLKVEKIDCCKKGCMLYYKDDSKLSECKFCSAPRFFPRRIGMGKYKDVPAKRMFYFPIIPRLQRLYASTESASEMRWHKENKNNSNLLRHPSDGKAWKHFDEVYPEFAREPRNVRLGLCSDGFTPYIQASAGPYSCWPIVVTPYNLPPEMCMTKPYLFLACLVPGPNNPKEKLDVYLQPLIDDLQQLWSNGILTYDISTKQNFIMKACLMWTINDFPAYGMLSGWGTQGRLACPHCMGDTKAFYLKNGGKNTWFGCNRRFLAPDHPFRKSKRSFTKNEDEKKGPPHISTGQEIWEVVSIFPKVTEVGWEKKLKELNDSNKDYKYGVHHNWRKRSIFWDLPYWKDNLLRHNLDVMHIEKNFFDNIFYTVMNITGKTKDNEKARKDMAECCFRGDLEMQALSNGKMGKPKAG